MLTESDLATQEIKITSDDDELYDTITYDAGAKPISVEFGGEYALDGNKVIFPFTEVLEFGLILDDRIESSGGKSVFRSTFAPGVDSYSLSITLPEQHVLYGSPAVLPKPDDIRTDGKTITLSWLFTEPEDVSVFYKGPGSSWYLWIVILVCLLIICVVTILLFKKKKIDHLLTPDENSVLELVKSIKRQDYIAKELEFSKSKMSKVTRKLEEKGLIKKKPYFKTNILEKL